MSDYHIVYSTDRNYLAYTFVACQSVIDTSGGGTSVEQTKSSQQCAANDKLVFHILIDDSVNVEEIQPKVDAFIKRNKDAIAFEIVFHHVTRELFEGCTPFRGDGNYSAYYRLLIDKILDESIEKVLYIDVDTLAKGDVRSLIDGTDMEGKVLGVAIDYLMQPNDDSHTKLICKSKCKSERDLEIPISTYFNSGVLLINMVEWRKQGIGSKCIELASKYNLYSPDQDLLNYVVQDRVYLSCSWNFMAAYLSLSLNMSSNLYDARNLSIEPKRYFQLSGSGINAREFESAFVSPNIVHFTVVKPWNYEEIYVYCGQDFYGELYAKLIKEWALTAAKVEEFSTSLSFVNKLLCLSNITEQAKFRYLIEVINSQKERFDEIRKIDKKRLRIKLYGLGLLNVFTLILLACLV